MIKILKQIYLYYTVDNYSNNFTCENQLKTLSKGYTKKINKQYRGMKCFQIPQIIKFVITIQ